MRHAYVYVDNSNIVHGAKTMPDGAHNPGVRVNVRELVRLIQGGHPCAERVVVGSNIPDVPRQLWEEEGYRIKSAERAAGQGERFVDEALHSCISHALLDPQLSRNPQVLVLATGDGNRRERTNSFPELADAAARQGWQVDVWAWRAGISARWAELQAAHPRLVHIRYLDDHRDAVTFVEARRAGASPPVGRAPHRQVAPPVPAQLVVPPAPVQRAGRGPQPRAGPVPPQDNMAQLCALLGLL